MVVLHILLNLKVPVAWASRNQTCTTRLTVSSSAGHLKVAPAAPMTVMLSLARVAVMFRVFRPWGGCKVVVVVGGG